jgi:hypothetical protein
LVCDTIRENNVFDDSALWGICVDIPTILRPKSSLRVPKKVVFSKKLARVLRRQKRTLFLDLSGFPLEWVRRSEIGTRFACQKNLFFEKNWHAF